MSHMRRLVVIVCVGALGLLGGCSGGGDDGGAAATTDLPTGAAADGLAEFVAASGAEPGANVQLDTCPLGDLAELIPKLATVEEAAALVVRRNLAFASPVEPATGMGRGISCQALVEDDPQAGDRRGITVAAALGDGDQGIDGLLDRSRDAGLDVSEPLAHEGGQMATYCRPAADGVTGCGASWHDADRRVSVSVVASPGRDAATTAEALTTLLPGLIETLAAA